MSTLAIGLFNKGSQLNMKVLHQKYRDYEFGEPYSSFEFKDSKGRKLSLNSADCPELRTDIVFVRGRQTNKDDEICCITSKRTYKNRLIKAIVAYNKHREPHIDFKPEDVCIECKTLKELRDLEY